MTIRRIPIENLADREHGMVVLEGKDNERLPSNRVYVNPNTGETISGKKGDRLSQLQGNEIELPRTTWFSVDVNRLAREVLEMQRVFNTRFQLYEDDKGPKRCWSCLAWVGFDPRGKHMIFAIYSKLHPYKQMTIKVVPDIKTHHKIKNSLCYMKDREWSPDWTAATAIATAIRFLTDYYKGRI